MTRMYEHHDAVLHSVREGVLIVGGDGRLVLANDEARRLFDLPPDAEGRLVSELGFDPHTAELLASGRPATDEVHTAGERLLSVSHRPTDRDGGPPGSVATLRDTTELRALSGKVDLARNRLKLLYDAGVSIGTTLDVVRTAQELAEYAVARFADYVSVDLADSVLRGEEPSDGVAGTGVPGAGPPGAVPPVDGRRTVLRRTALSGIRDDGPLYPLGMLIDFGPSAPQARGFRGGVVTVEPVLADFGGWQEQDPEHARRIVEYGIHSMITVPLRARGVVLGVASFMRAEKPEPFEEDDVSLAEELVTRAAVSIDNARRYTRGMWWGMGCMPRRRWVGCGRRCTTSPRWIWRRMRSSPISGRSGRFGGVSGPARRSAAGAGRAPVRDRRGGAARGQPAGALHRRADREA